MLTKKRTYLAWGVAAVSFMFAVTTHAGLIAGDSVVSIVTTDGGSLGTDPVTIDDPVGSEVSSISYGSGSLQFQDYDSDPLDVKDPTWWNAPGRILTTHTAGMIVDFSGLNVVGFTFNIGANQSAQAWIKATYDNGSEGTGSVKTGWFGGIGSTVSPGYGVYIARGNSCATIKQVEVDPDFEWGIGNFGVATGGGQCASVPEPGSLAMLGGALIGLGLMRRRRLTN